MFNCHETEIWRTLGRAVDLYLLPILCIIGLALNLACLIVFSSRSPIEKNFDNSETNNDKSLIQKNYQQIDDVNNIREFQQSSPRKYAISRRSHPLVPTLIVLSVCDSLQLLFSMFVLFLPALHDHLEMDPSGFVAQIAYIATGTLAGGLLASNCASIWTMCYITIQRHQAIVQPLSTVNTSKNSLKTVKPLICIALMALIFNTPVWFQYSWSIKKIDDNSRWFLIHEPSMLWNNKDYQFIMHKVLYPIAVYLIPLILISVLNMRMLSYIATRRVESVGHERRIAKERRSIYLLISIVVLFFLCHTGGLIIRFVDHQKYEYSACFIFIKDVVNVLFNVNSFANPFLYFFFTKQFKDLKTTWVIGRNNSGNKRFLKGLSLPKYHSLQ